MSNVIHGSELNQTDSMIARDRASRAVVAFATPVVVMITAWLVGSLISDFFHLWRSLGVTAALLVGGMTLPWLKSKSVIRNGTVTAFVTINPLVSFLNLGNPLVTYGPGTHFSFWWETRIGANNVDLSEVSVNYEVSVQCSDGTVDIKYSARLRPDIMHLPEFLAGAGSLATELGDLIATKIIMRIATAEVLDVLRDVAGINAELTKFKHGTNQEHPVSEFERRFGIIVGDVTVGKILPSKEVQETMSALTESGVIDRMVAQSFGKKSIDEVILAVKAQEIDGEEVNRRRTQAMAMSGNLQGMDLKESTFNLRLQGLKDIDPKIAEALAAVAPAMAAFAATRGPSQGNRRPNQPKKGGQ